MKKYITLPILVFLICTSFAQTSNSNYMFLRHDTSALKPAECEWIIKSLAKNTTALRPEIGNTVPAILLKAIEKGKLKAIDLRTNKPIPPKDIYKWQMPTDTVAQYDTEGNVSKHLVVQRQRSSDDISQIRIFQDWFLDIATGKLKTDIKWIELIQEVHTSSGLLLGNAVLCRIFY